MRAAALLLACAALMACVGGRADLERPQVRLTTASATQASSALPVASKPWFCHDLDCPRFKLIDNTSIPGVEVREYEPGLWATTEVSSYAYLLAVSTGFRRLFNYISGENEANVTVPMTAPVITRIEPSAGPFCKSTFTVSFFVPFDFQKDPPKPSSPDVYIWKTPKVVAFVGQSGGLKMDDWSIARMATRVYDAIDQAGLADKVITDFYFYAGYDPPFRLTGRHNEVMIIAKTDNITAGAEQQ